MEGRASRPSGAGTRDAPLAGLDFLRRGDELCGLGSALAQLFERAAERLAVCLRLRLLADSQSQPVHRFREPLGKVNQDYQESACSFQMEREFPERFSSSISVVMRARYSDDA